MGDRMKRLTFVVLLLNVAAGFCRAQQNDPAAASISGIVTDVSGKPLPSAVLVLELPFKETGIDVPPKPPPAYSASAEAQGRFEFPNIKPGDYFLTVKAAGYLPQSYRGRFGYPGTKISLIDRQKMTDVAFRLVQEAIITGRILNQDGDPIPGLRVFAERRTYPQNRALFQARVMTSADGVFSMSLSSGSITSAPCPWTGTAVRPTSQPTIPRQPIPLSLPRFQCREARRFTSPTCTYGSPACIAFAADSSTPRPVRRLRVGFR